MIMIQDKSAMGEVESQAYPMYFGVSCAFVALHLVSRTRGLDVEHGRWSRISELMLQGSAQLLGQLVSRFQVNLEALSQEEKLRGAELEIAELKQRRTEDAKANEKVAGIFAAHEQSWLAERKNLRRQLQVIVGEMRALKTKHEESVSDLKKRIEEEERAIGFKDEALEQEINRSKELEEKLQLAKEVAEELKERSKQEAQDHSTELWKHKTAFVELVSNQRQLEAEMSRALRQAEATKQELQEVFERKEEAIAMVEQLSVEIGKLQKDAEQKDKILSAMLRKCKIDTAEKHMLLKEVKISKAKKKQAQLEMEKWRKTAESRHKKSSRALHSADAAGCSDNWRAELKVESSGYTPKALLLDYFEAESRKDYKFPMAKEDMIGSMTVECVDRYPSGVDDKPATEGYHGLQDWVRMENEKYAGILEKRHNAEIEAFTEQMRLKDEKIESFRWRLLSMELETKRLQSHMEGLDGSLSHFREENIKLESLLLDKEKELKSLKERFSFHVEQCRKSNSNITPCPEVMFTRRRTRDKEQVQKPENNNSAWERDNDSTTDQEIKLMELESHKSRDIDMGATSSAEVSVVTDHFEDRSIVPFDEKYSSQVVPKEAVNLSDREEVEEEKEVSVDPGNVLSPNSFQEDTDIVDKLSSIGPSLTEKNSSRKMDIHALGVSYKIKRLRQQLAVLEKLVGSQAMKQLANKDDGPNDRRTDAAKQQQKRYLAVIPSLHKQLKRYQSLDEKTDDLCRRMEECYRTGRRDQLSGSAKEQQTETLEQFLEETFQLQRYMVATGQKLLEMQSMITSSFLAGRDGVDKSMGFNMGQFADVVRSLFREIQRGLEVRISRIIGDLEGRLASDGILSSSS
ncbi:uncharacterized protein [Typha latifolia]|uniref:uncharacterized protein n=1 Tax=Typha latifolia TaxID=4733 RepID=UPI003C2E3F3D